MHQQLEGFSPATSNLAQWVSIATGTVNGVAGSSVITIDIDGPGSGTVQQIIQVEGNLLGTDVAALRTSGFLVLSA